MSPSTTLYDQVRARIATELEAFVTDEPPSVPRLVGDLHAAIQAFRDRGGNFSEIAKIFERHGVEASPDGIRAALKRCVKPRKQVVSKSTVKTATAPVAAGRPEPNWAQPIPNKPPSDREVAAESDSSEPNTAERPPVIGLRLE